MNIEDWVRVKDGIGYIVNKYDEFKIVGIRFSNGETGIFSLYAVKPMHSKIAIDDIHSLQLLAVELNDRKWFQQLGELKQELSDKQIQVMRELYYTEVVK